MNLDFIFLLPSVVLAGVCFLAIRKLSYEHQLLRLAMEDRMAKRYSANDSSSHGGSADGGQIVVSTTLDHEDSSALKAAEMAIAAAMIAEIRKSHDEIKSLLESPLYNLSPTLVGQLNSTAGLPNYIH